MTKRISIKMCIFIQFVKFANQLAVINAARYTAKELKVHKKYYH